MRPHRPKTSTPKTLTLAITVAVLIGAAFWLQSLDTTKPLTKIEKVIPDNALAR